MLEAELWSQSRRLGPKMVSRRTNVSSRSRLGHLCLESKTNFRPNCAGHSTQCEWALNVVSLCVVTIAHHINTLKQWTWKITSRPVIAINKTCTLTSRSRLESYKRLVSVSSRNFNVSSWPVKQTSRSRLGLERLRLVPIPGWRQETQPRIDLPGGHWSCTAICAHSVSCWY